jgi:DivIVA domain-containing protein
VKRDRVHTLDCAWHPVKEWTPTTRSPEEIRHLTISRSVGGYDRGDVDRLLAEIADSFETVWHERTRLFEDVRQLQEQLRQREAAVAKLHDEAKRAETDRQALLAELERAHADVRELCAAMEQLEPPQSHRDEAGEQPSAELSRLRGAVEELRTERDRLLGEVQRLGAVSADERKMRKDFSDFLRNALTEVERVSSNGQEPPGPPSEARRDGSEDEGLQPARPKPEDKDSAPPPTQGRPARTGDRMRRR